MPEKGTSLINDTFRPVKKPRDPSYQYIFLEASIKLLYSEKPNTSNLVFITIKGLLNVVRTDLANAAAQKFVACSEKKFVYVSAILKKCRVLK